MQSILGLNLGPGIEYTRTPGFSLDLHVYPPGILNLIPEDLENAQDALVSTHQL